MFYDFCAYLTTLNNPDIQETNLSGTLEILAQVLPSMMQAASLWPKIMYLINSATLLCCNSQPAQEKVQNSLPEPHQTPGLLSSFYFPIPDAEPTIKSKPGYIKSAACQKNININRDTHAQKMLFFPFCNLVVPSSSWMLSFKVFSSSTGYKERILSAICFCEIIFM